MLARDTFYGGSPFHRLSKNVSSTKFGQFSRTAAEICWCLFFELASVPIGRNLTKSRIQMLDMGSERNSQTVLQL